MPWDEQRLFQGEHYPPPPALHPPILAYFGKVRHVSKTPWQQNVDARVLKVFF